MIVNFLISYFSCSCCFSYECDIVCVLVVSCTCRCVVWSGLCCGG